MRVIDRVRRFVQQHGLIRPESRVVLAVSGGSDSVAMLQVCRELSRSGDLKIAGIAHFNHQLRANANEHERFVAEAAVECDLPFVSDRENVGAIAAREHRSIEDAGRRARYAFYERARVALEGDMVAVGHTRDDQAETFLLRLTRGAGPRGLAGMHPRTGRIVRPLLDCGRAELREWLVKSAERGGVGCRFVEDETNEDVSIPRNRVRHELLPLLATRFNPAIVEVLARESALLQDVWAWMEEASVSCFETPGVLSVERLRRMPAGLQRLIVWRALRDAGDREITADHVASVIRLIREESGNQEKGVDVPGQRVQRIAGRIVLTNRLGSGNSPGSRGSNRENPENQFRYPLSIPGKVFIAETDLILSAEQGGPTSGFEPGGHATTGKGAEALVRRDLICGSLAVRNRRPGDRFHPVGLGGSKKIQDLFVDRKLARAERDQVPLVVDGGDRIIWVAGYGIDDAFRVTDPSQAVLVLRLTRASHGGAPECFGGSA